MSEKSDTNPTLPSSPSKDEADSVQENPSPIVETVTKKINEKVTCRCGKTVSKKQYNGHLNSGSHIKAMKELVDAKKELNEINPKPPKQETVETKKDNGAKLTILQLLTEMNKKIDHLVELNEDVANAIFEDDEDLMEPDEPEPPKKSSKKSSTKQSTKEAKSKKITTKRSNK